MDGGDAARVSADNFVYVGPGGVIAQFLEQTNGPIDQWTDILWNPVSSMLNFVGFAPTGVPKEQCHNSMGTHIVTPETESSCHYFFGVSRNFAVNDPAVDEIFRAWQKQALLAEDKPMVEAIQRHGPAILERSLKPAMLACDGAAVRVSREIDLLLRAEAG